MPRLVLLLAVVLGWVAYDRYAKAAQARPGTPGPAFPFPTSDAHDTISLRTSEDAASWCEALGCNEQELHAALRAVGHSASRVREHLAAG